MTINFRWGISPGEGEPYDMWYFPAAIAKAESEARDRPGETVKVQDNDIGLLLAIWRADGTKQAWRNRWPKAA